MTDPFEFRQEQWVASPRERVFRLFADPRNLALITPPALAFRIVTRGPITMGPGATIDYRLRVRGVPLRWRTLITRYEPGRVFVDEQQAGPYAEWVHEHRFQDRDGGTEILDHVRYRLKWWQGGRSRVGRLLDRALVRPDIARIFKYRQLAIERLLTEPPAAPKQSPALA